MIHDECAEFIARPIQYLTRQRIGGPISKHEQFSPPLSTVDTSSHPMARTVAGKGRGQLERLGSIYKGGRPGGLPGSEETTTIVLLLLLSCSASPESPVVSSIRQPGCEQQPPDGQPFTVEVVLVGHSLLFLSRSRLHTCFFFPVTRWSCIESRVAGPRQSTSGWLRMLNITGPAAGSSFRAK